MRSRLIARRLADNLRYAAVITELQGRPRVLRMKTFAGPLPGVDPKRG
mgnify:CR=1 FL=1